MKNKTMDIEVLHDNDKYDGIILTFRSCKGFEEKYEYDSNDKLVHYENSGGLSRYFSYDDNGNTTYIQIRVPNHCSEQWYEYDPNGNVIHYKDSNGKEYWKEYSENNICIYKKSRTAE